MLVVLLKFWEIIIIVRIRYNVSINDGYNRAKGEGNNFQERWKSFWLSGFVGNGNKRHGPYNSYIYNNTVFVNKDIVSKIAVDKNSKGVLVANNIFYFEGETAMVLGDQLNQIKEGLEI